MEKNIKKVNLVLVILIVMLLIGVGICGYILINKRIENKKKNENVTTNIAESGKSEKNDNNNALGGTSTQGNSIVNSTDEKFKIYSANMMKKINSYKNTEKTSDGRQISPMISIQIRGDYLKQAKIEQAKITPEGDLYIVQNGKDKKVKSNVISCFELEKGNGGNTYIMCINSDGTVSSIKSEDLIDKGVISVKNYTNAKNIVNLITMSLANAIEIYGVDIDGNICELQN